MNIHIKEYLAIIIIIIFFSAAIDVVKRFSRAALQLFLQMHLRLFLFA